MKVESLCAGLLSGVQWGMMGTQKALTAYRSLRQHFRPEETWQLLGIMFRGCFYALGAALRVEPFNDFRNIFCHLSSI